MSASASILARKLPRDSNLPTAEPRSFRVLSWTTASLAVMSLVIGTLAQGGFPVYRLAEFMIWAFAIAVADLAALRMWRTSHFGFSLPFLLASSFLFGPLVGGAIALIA